MILKEKKDIELFFASQWHDADLGRFLLAVQFRPWLPKSHKLGQSSISIGFVSFRWILIELRSTLDCKIRELCGFHEYISQFVSQFSFDHDEKDNVSRARDSKCYYGNITRGLLFSVILLISFSLQTCSLNLSDSGGKEANEEASLGHTAFFHDKRASRECVLLMTEVITPGGAEPKSKNVFKKWSFLNEKQVSNYTRLLYIWTVNYKNNLKLVRNQLAWNSRL